MIRIKREDLYSRTYDILTAIGEEPENAKIAADCLIRSDARGITTHGTYLLSPIVERAKAACLSLPTKIINDHLRMARLPSLMAEMAWARLPASTRLTCRSSGLQNLGSALC